MDIEITTRFPGGAARLQILGPEGEERYCTAAKTYVTLKLDEEQRILDIRAFGKIVRQVVMTAKAQKIEHLAIIWAELEQVLRFSTEYSRAQLLECLSKNLELANYAFDEYKSEKSDKIKTTSLVGNFSVEEKKACQIGQSIGKGQNCARDLANRPGSAVTPTTLLAEAQALAKEFEKIKVSALDEAACEKEGMGLFCAVGRGSTEPSQFITIEYQGGKKSDQPTALIGKGVTFDSGGLNVKPTGAIEDMAQDMSGAAATLAALKVAAALGLKQNIICLIPAVENAVSGSAYRPGDILTSLSGKTVRVGNTDAEGRLILADALTYAARFNPSQIIDVATLTGSACMALGQQASAIFSKDKELLERATRLGEYCDNRVWPLPSYDEYLEELESDFADLNNIGKKRPGDAAVAAAFLRQFVPTGVQHLHIDMAPRMTARENEYLEKGASGEPTALLVELLRS